MPDLLHCSEPHGAADYRRLLWSGGLRLHYQPIVNLRTGEIRGFEALGRLDAAGTIISPKHFLPHFVGADLLELLLRSIDQGVAAMRRLAAYPTLILALNVDPALLLDPDFTSRFLARLGDFDPRCITIELLESGEFLDTSLAHSQLAGLRAAGIRVALDDVGSGYSSLLRLRTMPVDKIKLDQVFVRELHRKPESLVFVSSVMSMAHGLNKSLVVEGVETPEILDALRVLGVELAQGFAIGRPMPETAMAGWLAAYRPHPATSRPHSLLGAYAAHLGLVEVCRALLRLPMMSVWVDGADNPHSCLIGQFFDEHGLHGTPMGKAHKRLHRILPTYREHQAEWHEAAEDFRRELDEAIQQEAALPAASPLRATSNGCHCAQASPIDPASAWNRLTHPPPTDTPNAP